MDIEQIRPELSYTELHYLYTWDCDHCGQDNYATRAEAGDGTVIMPFIVVCEHCKQEYKTICPEERIYHGKGR